MSSADEKEYGQDQLTRYLLGSLSEEEAERLDELSIADAAFVSSLNAVENDLVDSYVRDELSGEALERFKSVYLSSPKRVEKVEFARTLLRWKETTAAAAQASPTRSNSARHWFDFPAWGLQWGVALAALLLMSVTAGYLFVENGRLRRLGTESREQQAALAQRSQELERKLDDQRSANAQISKELESLRESAPVARALRTIAVLLLPPTRGAGPLTTVSVPPGTDRVTLRVQLESDDFPAYRVSLRDPVANKIVWRSGKLASKPEGEAKVVLVQLPAMLLKLQNYLLELSGVSAQGTNEFLSGYPFRVLLE